MGLEVNDTRAYVLAFMEEKFAEHGQRLFWLSRFERDEADVRSVVYELENEGIVEWRFEFSCPECEREWGGHPSNSPPRCMWCGYDILGEEGPEFFVPTMFAWKREAR